MSSRHTNMTFLAGGGEMGALTRAKDWSQTSLGSPSGWPQSLRTILSIILHSRFPMFLWWGPELICFYNDAYRPSLGENGKHPSILGMKAQEAWIEIWDTIYPLIQQVLTTGLSTWNEDRRIPIYRNGKLEDVYWTFSYSPVDDDSDTPAGVLVTVVETTGKVKAIQGLEESNTRYLNHISQAPVAMCFLSGPDHVVEVANGLMMEIWGKSPNQVMHKPIFEGLPESRGQGLEELLRNVFVTGEKFVASERPVALPRNGRIETTYLHFVYDALRQPDGTISGVVAIANDVTEQVVARKKLEESEERYRELVHSLERKVTERTAEIHAHIEELRKMNNELQSFAYVSSHDLQEPLRKIQLFASRLLEKEYAALSPYGKDLFTRMQSAAKRMQRLIDDLLAYSRATTAQKIFEKIDLRAMVAGIRDDLQEELQKKQVVLDLPNHCMITVIPFQFRQLLYNLISNAIKFSRLDVQPHIRIQCAIDSGGSLHNDELKPESTYCHVQISDNGIGFEPQYHKKIFELFQRLHSKAEYDGTGIGLAIVKKIVDNHGGLITASGALNKGATFDMYFPIGSSN